MHTFDSVTQRENSGENKNAIKAIAQTVPEFFFIYNLNQQTITYISPQFYQLSKQDLPEGLYQQVRCHIHPEDREQFDCLFTDLSPKNNYSGKIELRSNGNLDSIRSLEIYTHPVGDLKKDPNIDELVGHIQDITDRNKRLKLLEKENKKLDQIIKILGHDLRSPFNKISLIADLLRRNMSDDEVKKHSRLLNMLEEVQGHSMILLEQMLHLASVQGEAKHIQFERFDARELVDSAINTFSLQAEEKDVKLTGKKPDIQVAINADQLLLEQVVKNLMNNALKFTPAGGTVTIEARLFAPEKLELIVTDTGIGIAEEDLPHLFKEFTRIKKKGINGEPAIGLGLAICKQIVTLHQGKIWAESTLGKGTKFVVHVPC